MSEANKGLVRRRRRTLGRGDQRRRMYPKTPSRPGYGSVLCWPMAVIRECNFMEPEVCPWRILRTSPRRRSERFGCAIMRIAPVRWGRGYAELRPDILGTVP